MISREIIRVCARQSKSDVYFYREGESSETYMVKYLRYHCI